MHETHIFLALSVVQPPVANIRSSSVAIFANTAVVVVCLKEPIDLVFGDAPLFFCLSYVIKIALYISYTCNRIRLVTSCVCVCVSFVDESGLLVDIDKTKR